MFEISFALPETKEFFSINIYEEHAARVLFAAVRGYSTTNPDKIAHPKLFKHGKEEVGA